MKPSEWTDLVVWMRGFWPHASTPKEAVVAQHMFVADLGADAARGVVQLFASEGREHPPTGAMIAARAAELASPTPAWDQVQAEVELAIVAKRPEPEPLPCEACDETGFIFDETANANRDCECRAERVRRGQQRHEWSHEVIAEWMTPPRWQRWTDALNAGTGIATFRAQERESFAAERARYLEDRALALAGVDRAQITAPARLRHLRSGAGEPRQIDASTFVHAASGALTPE